MFKRKAWVLAVALLLSVAARVKQQAITWGWIYPNAQANFNGAYGPSYSNKAVSIYVTYIPPRLGGVYGSSYSSNSNFASVRAEVAMKRQNQKRLMLKK